MLNYTVTFAWRESETEKWKVGRFPSGMDARLVGGLLNESRRTQSRALPWGEQPCLEGSSLHIIGGKDSCGLGMK